jgi:hypothetical protein
MTFMPSKNSIAAAAESDNRPAYVKPTLTIMSEAEILATFQMTAAKISAAGCWWGTTGCGGTCGTGTGGPNS